MPALISPFKRFTQLRPLTQPRPGAPTPPRRRRRFTPASGRALTLCLMALGLGLLTLLVVPTITAASRDDATLLLEGALQKARDAGSYVIDIGLDQSITPEETFGRKAQESWAQFDVRGEIGGPSQARFALSPKQTTFTPDSPAAKEILVQGDLVYTAEGGRWIASPGAPGTIGLDHDGLSLLSVAKEVHRLAPAAGPGMLGIARLQYRRVGFQIASEDLLRKQLEDRGALDAITLARAQKSGTKFTGTGELWIDPAGYPARLQIDLNWRQVEDTVYRVHVHSETNYAGFGRRFHASRFDPNALPATGATDPKAVMQWGGIGLGVAGWLLFMGFLFVRAYKGNRRALQAATAIVIAGILTPSLYHISLAAQSDAAHTGTGSGAGSGTGASAGADGTTSHATTPGKEVANLMKDIRSVQTRLADDPNPQNALVDGDDEDADGLPNGYEVQYGTSPFSADTDFDGLTDGDEIKGIQCNGDGNFKAKVTSNPMMPDSNQDGLTDGEEFHKGKCTDAYTLGWLWDDDNDGDMVPDGLDLAPFSASKKQSLQMGGPWKGSNLTFETVDQNPDEDTTKPYPFYVEMQIRPKEADALRWAYKTVWWPEDDEAAIQVDDPLTALLKETFQGNKSGSTGEVKLVPLLQATVRERDLPTAKAMQAYGVSASQTKDGKGQPVQENGEQLWDMLMPLMTVERGGQVYAFQAKMLHDRRTGNDSLTRNWRNMRLKWAAVADVLMLDQNGKPAASPSDGYGLWLYDEPYEITGMQVSRQGGASMLVATALPTNQPYGDGPIALLRGGLEEQFLGGKLSLPDIKSRFNTPNNATPEQRWGIPQSVQFRVVNDSAMNNYTHLDQALATTTMTTTKQVLANEFDGYTGLKPSFLFASEQRTSTLNLDEDPPDDYFDITINTCLKPLVTSRSLKLQSYSYAAPKGEDIFGEWEPMSLDQVLVKVENEYAASAKANDPYYEEQLVILKMVATAWQVGVTSVTKIGQLNLIEISDILTDTEMVPIFLDENSLVPTDFKTVINQLLKVFDAGGPVAWLQQQWTTVVETFDSVDHVFRGSYLDMANKTPDSYIKVIPQGDQPGQQGPPETPVDEKIAGYTLTFLTVLGLVATIVGDETFSTVVDILTKVVEIYQKFRAIVDTIKTIINVGEKAQNFATAAAGLTKELGSLVKPMAVVGLIFAVAIIWVAVLVMFGDLGPNIALTVVVQAIVETVLAVVLFVVAAIFPYGTIVAIAIGLIKLIESLIGFQFDPISLLLDWLFGVEAVQRVDMAGDPTFGELKIEPQELGGGIVSGAKFRLSMPATATMKTINDGTKTDLGKSKTSLHVGRFNDWPDLNPNICTPSMDLFNEYKKALGGYYTGDFHAQNYHCVYFNLPAQGWGADAGHSETKGSVKTVGGHKERTDQLFGFVDVNPSAGINRELVLDLSMDVKIRYDQCATVGGCDEYTSESISPPALSEFYFDLLPGSVHSLWNWDEVNNYDIDGDGLTGYVIDKVAYGADAKLCPNLPSVTSWDDWDSDDDGLSDNFEVSHSGYNPCSYDTDKDGIKDGVELVIGTKSNDTDTDGDGLTDHEEVPFDNGFKIQVPWEINLSQQYPGLPNPPAYPNPRVANFDADHRNDKEEKKKGSSPTSYNAVPVGDPVTISIGQTFKPLGVQSFIVQSSVWENDEAVALNASLTLTLPFTLTNAVQVNKLQPLLPQPWLNYGSPQISLQPNVFGWLLPPASKGRYLKVDLSGVPAAPTGPLTITATYEYDEGAKHQVSTASVPLLVNLGGPVVTFTGVTGAVVLSGLDNGNAPFADAGAGATADGNAAGSAGVSPATSMRARRPRSQQNLRGHVPGADANPGANPSAPGGADSATQSGPATGDGAREQSTRVNGSAGRMATGDGAGVDAASAPVDIAENDSPVPATAPRNTAHAPASTLGLLGGGMVTIHGMAEDPDRVSKVLVCVKLTDTCGGGDWKYAALNPVTGVGGWTYNFMPAADGTYFVRAYGIDNWGLAGYMAPALTIGVDQSAPGLVSLDLGASAFVSTSVSAGKPKHVRLTGKVSDAVTRGTGRTLSAESRPAAGYVSGAGKVSLLVGGDTLAGPVDQPGQPTSSFGIDWAPPHRDSVRTPSGDYALVLGAADVAGNPSPVTATLHLVVDDLAPVVHATPPQAVNTGGFSLTGLADDTALVGDRSPAMPFASTKTTANAKTQFNPVAVGGKAVVVGDVTGDQVDDVVLLAPATAGLAPVAFRAGLFFGRPGGLPATLSMNQADVTLTGETPFTAGAISPSAAGVGDVNGDGVGDLLLGDPAVDTGKGRAYLVAGRRGGWTTPLSLEISAWRLSIADATAFGGTVAGAGDVNGDGLADILVGASNRGRLAGGAWLYLGREQGAPAAPATVLLPPTGAAAAPPNLAGLGDANGDGLGDFLVAYLNAATALVHGRTTDAWPAGVALGTEADALMAATNGQLTVAGPGDVNGDGLADLLLGDPEGENPRVFLVHGRRPETPWPAMPQVFNLVTQSDASWMGPRGSRLGAGLAGFGRMGGGNLGQDGRAVGGDADAHGGAGSGDAGRDRWPSRGDADRDGRADFAMGEPGIGSGPNRVALMFSKSLALGLDQPVETAAQLISGTVGSQRFGEYLSIGDVSADHVPDLLVGATGENKAYLGLGDFDPGGVAGVSRVEVGLFGPVTNPGDPMTATLPTAWQTAALTSPNARLTAFAVPLSAPVAGDYRVYARALDRAGNRLPDGAWYLGNVWASVRPTAFAGTVGMNVPSVTEQTALHLDGSLDTGPNTRHFRVFDGFGWHRMPPMAGAWTQFSTLPRVDKTALSLRAVARDAFGNTAQALRNMRVDTLVVPPLMTPSLPVGEWQTDVSPNLVVTWPQPVDASGINGVWAAIDADPATEPSAPAAGNQVARTLNQPGVYFAHLRLLDGAGNESTAHLGPFLVNRTLTPSVVEVDGKLDMDAGEYPTGTLLAYDPYAAKKPAAVWGTWDASRLYLGLAGHGWGSASPLTLYFDTKPGGLTSTLGPTTTHTLPFGADVAVIVGRPQAGGMTVLKANGGAWSPSAAPKSRVAVELDTELALDRAELELTGAVALVVTSEDFDGTAPDGLWAVLPAAARSSTRGYVNEAITMGGGMTWPALADGRLPNQGLGQVVAPEVAILPEWDNVLSAGKTATFRIVVRNPDVGRYADLPLDLSVDPNLEIVSLLGAVCKSCPRGASKWTLLANVAPGSMQTITVQARALGENVVGVLPLPLSAGLEGSGLPGQPQPPAEGTYRLDHGTLQMKVLSNTRDSYVQPGDWQIGIQVDQSDNAQLRCATLVEVNPGNSGWKRGCWMGDCTVLSGNIGRGLSQVIQLRTTTTSGRSSTPIQHTVIADDVAPTAQISATQFLSGSVAYVQGTAWDTFPTSRAPVRVEVSIDGKRFHPAILVADNSRGISGSLVAAGGAFGGATAGNPAVSSSATSGSTARSVNGSVAGSAANPALPNQQPPVVARWRFPLHLTREDGKVIQVVARAIDEAGNVGRGSTPVSIVLDNLGPVLTGRQDGEQLRGTVRDGAGVAGVWVSLDGGRGYLPVGVRGAEWTFDLAAWPGSIGKVALVRAMDVHGNITTVLVEVTTTPRVTLPPPTATGTGPTPTMPSTGPSATPSDRMTATPTATAMMGGTTAPPATATPTATATARTGSTPAPSATATSPTGATPPMTPTPSPTTATQLVPPLRVHTYMPFAGKRVMPHAGR